MFQSSELRTFSGKIIGRPRMTHNHASAIPWLEFSTRILFVWPREANGSAGQPRGRRRSANRDNKFCQKLCRLFFSDQGEAAPFCHRNRRRKPSREGRPPRRMENRISQRVSVIKYSEKAFFAP